MSEDTMARQGRDMEKPEGIVILFLWVVLREIE